MKKALCAIFFVEACKLSAYVYDSYEEFMNKFKADWCAQHKTFLAKEEYRSFIEHYCKEAESTLEVLKYYKHDPDFWIDDNASKLINQYFNTLVHYIDACFLLQCHPGCIRCGKSFKKFDFRLATVLSNLKQFEKKLNDLDPTEEYKKTTEFVERANKEYFIKEGIKNFSNACKHQ